MKKDFTYVKSFFCFNVTRRIFHFCLFCLFPFFSIADFDFNANVSVIQSEIFNLHFEKATQLIEQERKLHSQNAALLVCENNLDFLRAFLSEQDSDFKKLKDRSSERLEILEDESEESPWFLNSQAEIIFQRAVVRAKYNEFVGAAFDVRKAFRLFKRNHEKFPGFQTTLKGLGVLHIIIGSIPENYKWIAKLGGLNGTITQGMAELQLALDEAMKKESDYPKNEILMLYIYFETHLNKDFSKAYELLKLYDADYVSQLITFSIANVYFADGKNDAMIDVLLNRKKDKAAYPLNYLDFLIGLGKLNRLDIDASDYFRKYTQDYKGSSFIKAGWQKLAWLDLIFNEGKNYDTYISELKIKGKSFTDEDKQAEKEAESGIRPNVILLKSRLLFDGGYYLQSLAQIANKTRNEFPTPRDRIEFVYRTARNFDKLSQADKAITFYKNVIDIVENNSYYFAAFAALSLGQIYENQNDKQDAISYYKKCLNMRNHEYQNSIDQKAKAGLNRLKAD